MLKYIWSNTKLNTDILFSPYTKKAAMIPLEEGKENLGIWQTYSVNILKDYRKIFGSDPPSTASLAIMGTLIIPERNLWHSLIIYNLSLSNNCYLVYVRDRSGAGGGVFV